MLARFCSRSPRVGDLIIYGGGDVPPIDVVTETYPMQITAHLIPAEGDRFGVLLVISHVGNADWGWATVEVPGMYDSREQALTAASKQVADKLN